jgi:general secretion pathway protein M
MNKKAQQRLIFLQALILLVLAAAIAAAANFVWQKHQSAQSQLEENEPLYARMLGLESSASQLVQAEQTIKTQLTQSAYPSDQTAVQAGNDAQQKIRTLFVSSKLDIASIQVLPPKELSTFDRVGVVLRVEGDLTGMHNAMLGLQALKPFIFLDSVNMQVIGPARPKMAPRLLAQFNFSVLRLRS